MKTMNLLAVITVAFLGCVTCSSGTAPQNLKVVFIGDSITYGYLLAHPETDAPPVHAAAFLQGRPGISGVQISNCGRNAYRTDQFLPGSPGSAWPQVKAAADAYTNSPGALLFSIMIGANDSVSVTPSQYGVNLKLLVNTLLSDYPAAKIVLHHPLWYTKVPSTHPEVLKQYIPVIDALIRGFGQSHPGRVDRGDVKGWEYFETNHATICFTEEREGLPYYIHPNEIGAPILGQYWGEAIYRAVMSVVAYWPFGLNGLADVSGNGHSLVKGAAGVSLTNGLAHLDGTQTQFSTAQPLDLSGCTNLTVEFWMRTAASADPSIMLEHTEDCNVGSGAFIVMSEGNYQRNVRCGFMTSGGYNLDESPEGVVTDGEWHHVAMVYDASKAGADRSMLYFNQVAQPPFLSYTAAAPTAFRNAYLYISSRANKELEFIGDLDDIRISNVALETNDFLQVRSNEEVKSRVVAYWDFSGNGINDASGNGHTLTNNGVSFIDGAAVFGGSQTMFSTVNTLDLSSYNNLTVECFIRTTSLNNAIVFEHSANTTLFVGAFCSAINDFNLLGNITGALKTSAAGYNIEQTAAGAMSDGLWHHVALVIDSTKMGADRAQLYFDRARQGTVFEFADATALSFRNEILYIGSRANSANHLIGQMDDLRITSNALVASQFIKQRSHLERGTSVFIQ